MARSQKVVTLPVAGAAEQPDQNKHKRVVTCSQAAINALARDGREYSVAGVPGLLVRPGPRKISYLLVRRVAGRLVKVTLAAESLSQARIEASRRWAELKPSFGEHRIPTLAEAVTAYIEARPLAQLSKKTYEKLARLYLLPIWGNKRLHVIAADRNGFRNHMLRLERERSKSVARNTARFFNSVYQWHAKVFDLPRSPVAVYDMPKAVARDWALGDSELKLWYQRVRELPAMHRTWLLTALMTGARLDSISNLKWPDIDFQAKTISFTKTKGSRPYVAPLADRLAVILQRYRDNGWIENSSNFVFPSSRNPEKPYLSARKVAPVRAPHSLRHSLRTMLARVGAPVEVAQLILGHSFGTSVSAGYLTRDLLLEPARKYLNEAVEMYARICGMDNE
jgi:integrase